MSSSATGDRQPILAAAGLAKSFAGLLALQDFSLTVPPGEIVGLIGPNGAGKTTCFNVITGFLVPTAGQIQFRGEDVTGLQPAQTARLGMARTFQNIRLFGSLTVLENVQVAAQLHQRARLVPTLLGLPSFHKAETLARRQAAEILDLLGLQAFGPQAAGSLPYGLQRRLEIARALATDPKLILLDEPTAGMNPQETQQAMDLIFKIRDMGLAVVVIEHDMRFIFQLCDRVLCLVRGEALIWGTPGEVQSDPRVIEAYIGGSELEDDEDDA